MQRFAALYAALDASTGTDDKLAALVAYLADAPAEDAAWAVYLLAGGRPRLAVPTAVLRAAALAASGLPDWLFEASYQAVGDLAETIARVLPEPDQPMPDGGLARWMTQHLPGLRALPPPAQAAQLQRWWAALPVAQRFLLVKLIGGGFRVGVSRLLVQRALARHAGLDPMRVAERMMGWTDASHRPDAAALARLLAPATAGDRPAVPAPPVTEPDLFTPPPPESPPDGTGPSPRRDGQPYPFFLAQAPDGEVGTLPQRLGARADWLAEWKYDGMRAQLVRRAGQLWIWSRGEELVTERFPELQAQAQRLPDGTVLDGELLVWRDGAPAPFNELQQRIGRKTVSRRLLADKPVTFLAYDLLEQDGVDLRSQPQWQRRAQLEGLMSGHPWPLSPLLPATDWAALAALRADSRARGVEGLMLKHREAAYGIGRSRAQGLWWKWKVDPMTIDAVLIYAQAGHGRRAGVYTDYTFALWNRRPADAAEAEAVVQAIAARQPPDPQGLQLVPFAKAYSGLSDAEFAQVDREIRAHTLEKFGPVRSVRPTLVMELAFEAVHPSTRHRSGLALRFPRLLRLRTDKALHDADDLPTLAAMMVSP